MKSYTLKIDGMSCGHCIKVVAAALQAVPDVTVRKVDLGHARINCPPARLNEVTRAIQGSGYDVETEAQGDAA